MFCASGSANTTRRSSTLAVVRSVAWSLFVLVACGRENFDDAGSRDSPSVTMQGDQDGDGVDSSTDTCPHLFNQSQADADADGIGDACDPRPGIAGDKLYALGLFATTFGDFAPDAVASWSMTGDSYITTTAATDATGAKLAVTSPAAEPTLQTAFVVRDYGQLTFERFTVRLSMPNGNTWDCAVNGTTSFINRVDLGPQSGSTGSPGSDSLTPSIAVDQVVTVSMTRDELSARCVVNGRSTTSGQGWPTSTMVTATIEILNFKGGVQYAALYGIQ